MPLTVPIPADSTANCACEYTYGSEDPYTIEQIFTLLPITPQGTAGQAVYLDGVLASFTEPT
jgi:hypothetical protein